MARTRTSRSAPNTGAAAVAHTVAGARRRLGLALLVATAGRTLAIAGSIAALLVIALKLFAAPLGLADPGPLGWAALIAAPLLIALAAATLAARRRWPSRIASASALDALSGTHDLLGSSLALSARDNPGPFERLTLHEAAQAATRATTKGLAPLAFGTPWAVGLGTAALAALLAWFAPMRPAPLPGPAPLVRATSPEAAAAATAKLDEAQEALEAAASTGQVSPQQLAAIDELERELAEGLREPEDALAAAAETLQRSAEEAAKRAQRDQLASDAVRERLSSVKPGEFESARELAESLAEGDLQSAADEAERLLEGAQPAPSQERQQLADELRRLADEIQQTPPDPNAAEPPPPPPPPPSPEEIQQQLEREGVPPEDARQQAEEIHRQQQTEHERQQTEQQSQQDAQRLADELRKQADELSPPDPAPQPPQSEPSESPESSENQNQPQSQPQPSPTGEAPKTDPAGTPEGEQQPSPGEQPNPGEGQPKPGEGQPQPGEGQPQPGKGQPQPGEGQPQPGEGQPQPGEGQPQPGEGQPQPGEGQPQPGDGQPQPGEGQPQPGEGQPQPGTQGQPTPGTTPQPSNQPGTQPATQPGESPSAQPGSDSSQPGSPTGGAEGEGTGLGNALRQLAERQQSAKDAQNTAHDLQRKADELTGQSPGGDQLQGLTDQLTSEQSWQGQTEFLDARADDPPDPEQESIIAEWLNPSAKPEGAPASGRIDPAQTVRQAEQRAQRALEQQAVPRRHADLIKRVFGRYAERAQDAAPASAPPPADAEDAP